MLKRKEAVQLSVANIVVYQLFLCVFCLCRGKRIGNMQVDVLFFFMAELANFYFIFLTNTTKSTSSCFILLFFFFFYIYWFLVHLLSSYFFCRENSKIEYDSPDTRKRQVEVKCNQDCAQKEKNRKRMVTIKLKIRAAKSPSKGSIYTQISYPSPLSYFRP